jgi:hypothetical protein
MEKIKYTTINKLKKEGKLSDSDMIGDKLKSEKARQLYGDNIRVHYKHYIPKDKRKYFHDEEIIGGSLKDALKKVGSFLKHKYEKVVSAVKPTIKKVGEKVSDYVDTVFTGRNDYPPAVREFIKKYGDSTIKAIVIDRTPVVQALQSVLNFVSGGKFNERLKSMPFDKIFHLRVDITFDNDEKIAVEKNEVINMYANPKLKEGGQQKVISNIPQGLTLNHMLEEARKIQGKKYFDYSAYNNNCQDFIMALLKGSNIGTQEDYDFVKQDSKALFKNDPFLRKFANTVTDIGGKANEIMFGSGLSGSVVQSVLFSKPEWTKRRAVNWLKKHDFTGLEVDDKPEHFRFRQVEPSKKCRYATKSIGNDIEFIIMYSNKSNKDKTTNKVYNKMPRKYESDSDTDSSSDEEYSGTGIAQERAILKRMAKLKDDVKSHHAVHGGKINIAKAFKKLGKTIKRGWEKEIEDPAEKLANKAGKYITAKKGGLATDLIDYAVPAATSALVGGLAGMATGGVGGVLGSAAGSKLGKEVIAKELHKATGAGRKKMHAGDLVHIDIDSHNTKGKKATSTMEGGRLKKGSAEAKEHMARIRAMRKN